jgi:integrase
MLKAVCRHAYKQGWIGENLSGRITMLKERNKREVYLTKTQVWALIRGTESLPTRAAIMIAAYSGLRASELLALPRTTSRAATLSVTSGKSKTGKPRVVPIAGPMRPYLSALPLALDYWQLHKQFLVARKKAGMPHLRFHDLRHTCASWLINAGVDLYTVGKILGHSGPQTTARYAHLADATLKKAMARLK